MENIEISTIKNNYLKLLEMVKIHSKECPEFEKQLKKIVGIGLPVQQPTDRNQDLTKGNDYNG